MSQDFSFNDKTWDVAELHRQAEGLPVEEVSVTLFGETIEVWGSGMIFAELAIHIRRVLDADLAFPVILSQDGVMMDGYHRLTKALLEGRKTLLAVRLPIVLNYRGSTPAPVA